MAEITKVCTRTASDVLRVYKDGTGNADNAHAVAVHDFHDDVDDGKVGAVHVWERERERERV